MSKKGSSAPPPAPPDYTALANQQAQMNTQAAQTQAQLARVNQSNPYGSLTWSQGPDNQWSATTTLSPQQQALLTSLQGGQQRALGAVNSTIGQAPTAGPLQTSAPTSQFQGINAQALPNTSANQQAALDMSNLPQLNQDYAAQAQQAQNANYQLQAQQLDPQYRQQETQMRARLINSGITPGSQAYDQAVNDFERQKQQAYGNARLSSVAAGNQEAALLNQQANQAYNSLFGAQLQAGQFGNNANLTNANFGNQAAQQNFQNQANAAQFNNTNASNLYAEQLQNAQLNNSAQNQGYNQQLTNLQLPISQYQALLNSPVQGEPAAQQFSTQNINAAPIYQAGQDQYAQAVRNFNYNNAQAASHNFGTLAGNFFSGNWGGPQGAGANAGTLLGGNSGVQF